jgi:septum formation protein
MLAALDLSLVARAAHIDESPRDGEPPGVYLDRIVHEKLNSIRGIPDQGLAPVAGILVADTIVVTPDGSLLGKPVDDSDARHMLERLAGATHHVSTRFLLAEGQGPEVAHAQTVTTRVTFRVVSDAEATAYVASGEGRDKAGGYAVQGKAAAFVERIEGSYTNVVGLPLCEVVVAMRALGWI